MRSLHILAAAALLCATATAALKPTLAPYSKNAPVDVQAASFQSLGNGWVSAEGNVIVRQNDAQVTADRVRINRESGEVVAEGNVILVREGQIATRSDRISYNFKTGEGLTPGLDVVSDTFHVMAGPSQRDAYGFFHLSDAIITTCTNAPSCLHYAVTAKQGEFKPGEYVQLHGATVRFFDVPVFYYPRFRRSLVDHFGWRFEPGYESDWGAYLLTTYKMQLFDLGGVTHDSIDSHSHFDYRTERGFAFGEDI
jgi:lipopolysaccharide assembly outer membrane protein LptD (OstA)